MKKILLLFLLHFLYCLYSVNCKAQTIQYKQLLDSAIKSKNLFVGSGPISKIRLDKNDIRENYSDLKEVCKNVDTFTLFQIIDNFKTIDTTFWTDDELDKVILIQNRDQNISSKNILQKFNTTDKKKIRFYRKQVNDYNRCAPIDRDICYYSRPVFDNSRQIAIIEWDKGHSQLGGGGGIIIYKLSNGIWNNIGILTRWNY